MATCPNCGEIVMEGDPYCSNCGTTFRWTHGEDERYDPFVDFTKSYSLAKRAYDNGSISAAFTFLVSANEHYRELDEDAKRKIGRNPFHWDWVVDIFSQTVNSHGRDAVAAINIAADNLMPVGICMDCYMFFPVKYSRCPKCGKPLDMCYYEAGFKVAGAKLVGALRGVMVDDATAERLALRSMELLRSNDCRFDRIVESYEIYFYFIKDHEYFYTTYECVFMPYSDHTYRLFEDCNVKQNHDRLLADASFKKLVRDTEKRTGFTFEGCSGGYDIKLDYSTNDEFTFTDDYKVFVRFRIDDERVAVYDIDLDEMKLSRDYEVY